MQLSCKYILLFEKRFELNTKKDRIVAGINKKGRPKPPSMSGYQDSNLGPPAPKAGALAGLRYTPISLAEGVGFEPTDRSHGHGLANRSFNHSGNPPEGNAKISVDLSFKNPLHNFFQEILEQTV